ncbi:hypothetical protein B0H63DRAFT_508632 [Podospora didyma]|uniref:Uncharacterized protein n=1 Tax=Podospora didyma TaxID=330526 RepID=A0AAE0NS65_9PEZI|nr:hypothetical protein B0H63DRAFT_508632 [Podospora didyma]
MLSIKSLVATCLVLASVAQCSIFDTTITPEPFPTTVFAPCKTADTSAVLDFNSCTFNAALNDINTNNCLYATANDAADSSRRLACCTRAVDLKASCMTGSLKFCTGSITYDPVYLCQHWTRAAPTGNLIGGSETTKSGDGAHWPVATGGLLAAAVGVAGLLI